jgi:hypothetical protein
LNGNGADEDFIDNGAIADEVRKRRPEGYSKIIGLFGVVTMAGSLNCVKEHGIVCITGIVGGKVRIYSSITLTEN